MEELVRSSAVALAQAIRTKKVSSEEVVKAHLRRIEEVNPKLNAVVLLTADAAIAEARKADAALARGDLKGPLHGVPMTIKDSLETAGIVSTAGTQGRASFVPSQDAPVVSRLRAAGAILLGKTNLPELSLGFESINGVYGRTNNPYNLACTPGGSSGGEAAIIAAGGSPLGLGADAGGSIRLPAHFCGIAGLKPTTDRVPRTGHFPPFGGVQNALWQIGPMARFVEDLILTFPIIAGMDWRDPAIVPMPLGDPGAVDLRKLRVAFHTDNGILSPTPETSEVVKRSAKILSEGGSAVEEARPQGIEQANEIISGIFGADGGAGVRKALQMAGTKEANPFLRERLEVLGPFKKSIIEFGDLLDKWDDFRRKMFSFLEGHDVIICPACACPALPHGSTHNKLAAFSYTRAFNLTGWPAVVVRGGTSPEGLPIGVQVVARPWREDVVLGVAKRIEAALGGWQRPPL